MKSRKEVYQKKAPNKVKLLFGTLFLSIGIGSSISVVFADQDIEGILTNWFNNQKTKSIETIENAIMSEKEIQMQRLKEELQIEMKNAEKELEQYTEQEKEQRINSLKLHTDKLIKGIKIDNTKEKEKIIEKLNIISQDAIDKMEKVSEDKSKDNEKAKVNLDATLKDGEK